MDIYDKQAVSAVWQRVHQGREKDKLEEALSEAIGFERRAASAYHAMARCSGNPLFLRLSAQENCHAKKLSALYYLLFECPPCEQSQCPPRIDNFCQAVREAYRGEKMAIERYERMANDHPEHRELFCALAMEEKCHVHHLHRLAEQFLNR